MIQLALTIGFLVILEGLLSFDNALVLAAMVSHLRSEERKKALTYGIVGAFAFRFLSLFCLTWIMQSALVKCIGAVYLLGIGVLHFCRDKPEVSDSPKISTATFWYTVATIELADIAFSIDSILASIAVSKQFYIVLTGGILGIVMMRFVASLFVKLIERFPNLENSAYMLVILVGFKMLTEALKVQGLDYDNPQNAAFWGFWMSMLIILLSGFRRTVDEVD